MTFFSIIPDAKGILHSRGLYRQVDLYTRGDRIYARWGSGFVRLIQGGSTSHVNVKWAELDAGEGAYREQSGYVTYIAPAGQIEGSAAKAVAAE